MKKNLRIVSVAAAALLAVAPVAATTVSNVNAADSSAVTTATKLGDVGPIVNGATVNVTPNITLNTSVPGTSIETALSASFSATVNGTTATATLTPLHNGNGEKASSIQLFKGTAESKNEVKNLNEVTNGDAGATYKVQMNRVGLNFGSQNANKKVTLTFPDGAHFSYQKKDLGRSGEVQLDSQGTVELDWVIFPTVAKDFANPAIVNWRDRETGATVTTGNVTLYAGSDAGKMNVKQVLAAIARKYYAENSVRPQSNEWTSASYTSEADLAKQLEAQGMKVTDGWFVANKSFTVNYKATAANNDASSTLAVTVNVPNGKVVTPATVPSQSKTIMHNAYFYDKDAKRVGTDKVTRYNTVTVAMNKTKFSNGIEYYEVVENNKLSGKFINADNIDGTKRTLKHNAYVYRSSKKRANKVVLKKGETVTTYGGSYTFKNGKKYYKIGNDTKKTYVKVANFD